MHSINVLHWNRFQCSGISVVAQFNKVPYWYQWSIKHLKAWFEAYCVYIYICTWLCHYLETCPWSNSTSQVSQECITGCFNVHLCEQLFCKLLFISSWSLRISSRLGTSSLLAVTMTSGNSKMSLRSMCYGASSWVTCSGFKLYRHG